MSFIDMAFLRKKDLQNGILSYRRQKTGQQLFIKWEKPMQEIIDRYDTQGSPYLLPIIRDMEVDGRKQYKKTAQFGEYKKLGKSIINYSKNMLLPNLPIQSIYNLIEIKQEYTNLKSVSLTI